MRLRAYVTLILSSCWVSMASNAISDDAPSVLAEQEKGSKVEALLEECRLQGIEEETALHLLGALESTNATEALKSVQTLAEHDLARSIALGLRHPHANVKFAAVEQLMRLKNPDVTPEVIEALQRENFVQEGSEKATAHIALVTRLIGLLNELTGADYKLDNPRRIRGLDKIIELAREKAMLDTRGADRPSGIEASEVEP